MKTVDNFLEYVRATPGTHCVYTGTFDPVTIGHLDVVSQILEQKITDNPLLIKVNPDPKSKPDASPYHLRQAWMTLAIQDLPRDFSNKILLCIDPIHHGPLNGLIGFFGGRVIRVIGSDKVFKNYNYQLEVPREHNGVSSTKVRELAQNHRLDLAGDLIPPSLSLSVVNYFAKDR